MFFSPTILHIPDGFLSLLISVLFWVCTIGMVGIAVSKTNQTLGEKQIPLMGVMAAFIFAAQMLNFPIAGGTSGHFLGGTLAAIVLGPWAGILVMTAVVGVQALLFQDGGLLVMGANIFNMGILPAVIGFGLYRIVIQHKKSIRMGVAGVAAWIATIGAALLTSLQLWLSGTTRLELVIPAMLGVHALIGIGEGLITVAALTFIEQTRPDLMDPETSKTSGGVGWIVSGVIVSILAVLISPYASGNPDGLERVAEDLGFLEVGLDAPYRIFSEYSIPFLGNSAPSTILAGMVGITLVMVFVIIIGRNIHKSKDV